MCVFNVIGYCCHCWYCLIGLTLFLGPYPGIAPGSPRYEYVLMSHFIFICIFWCTDVWYKYDQRNLGVQQFILVDQRRGCFVVQDWRSWGQSVLVCKQSVVASRWIDQVVLQAAFSSTANDDWSRIDNTYHYSASCCRESTYTAASCCIDRLHDHVGVKLTGFLDYKIEGRSFDGIGLLPDILYLIFSYPGVS